MTQGELHLSVVEACDRWSTGYDAYDNSMVLFRLTPSPQPSASD